GQFAPQEAPVEAAAEQAPAAAALPAPSTNWPLRAAQGWLLLYVLGLAVALGRLVRAQRIVGQLARAGMPLGSLHDHAGFGAVMGAAAKAPAVIEVDAAISPMLIGLLQPRLLLPLQLRQFDATQQRLIIAHELTHWRRHDLQWMGAAVALQTVFWFHPIMRKLRQHLCWAQELACDRAVLQGRAPLERKAYAAALLAQLKIHSAPHSAGLAFGGAGLHSITSRIALIRAPFSGKRSLLARCVALAGVVAVFSINLVLQPALAWHASAPLPSATASTPPAAVARTAMAAGGKLDCTLIVDGASGKTLVSEGDCNTRITPASTFNIVVSLMGFDSGILQDAHAPLLQYRAGGGFADWNPKWRRATDPTSWIVNSSAWYAQQVTARLGEQRMAAYLDSFNYGNRDASGDPGKNNGLKMSWISSSMQISPIEQVAFLRKVAKRELPISAHAYDVSEQILAVPAGGGWQAYGKTGTAAPRTDTGAVDQLHSYGWFVGWARKDGRTIVFARLLEDRDRPGSAAGPRLKQAFLKELPARFDSL
ncbi:MAG: class beta-lactamase, partial [Massilia sp.]|nr:class beta-lactamase [Massilia sp.]